MQETHSADILIVEDDPAARRAIERSLLPLGLMTAGTASARTAYELVLARPPRLMLVDWVLDPGPSGLRLLQLIKADPRTKPVRVGLLTGLRREDDDEAEAIREGADFFMLKEPCEGWRHKLASRGAQALALPARRAAHRVLVVEDDPGTSALFAQILGHAGYEVLCAHSGTQGLALARRRRLDAVILDIHLPGIDGFELIKQLRRDGVDPHLPVLATSHNKRELSVFRSAAMGLGATRFFDKDELRSELASVVEELVLSAVRRRFGNSRNWLCAGPLEVHEDAKLVLWHGQPLQLGARLYSVLIVLLRHPAGVSAEGIAAVVDERLDRRSLQRYLERLRAKLGYRDALLCRDGLYRLAWSSENPENSKTCRRLSLTSG